MKLTRSLLRKLLLEQFDWLNSDDFDFQSAGLSDVPGVSNLMDSKRVLYIFDWRSPEFNMSRDELLNKIVTEDKYQYGVPSGKTHGRDSHALKHYAEYDPEGLNNMCMEIIFYLTSIGKNLLIVGADRKGTDAHGNATGLNPPYIIDFIKDYEKPDNTYKPKFLEFEPINESKKQKFNPMLHITPGDIINTLDRIQDTVLEDGHGQLSDIEIELYNSFFMPVVQKYDQIRVNLQSLGMQNDVSDAIWKKKGGKPALRAFLETRPVIMFGGMHYDRKDQSKTAKTYFYNLKDSSMSSIPNNETATLYRYYKVGDDKLDTVCSVLNWLKPTQISNFQQYQASKDNLAPLAGQKPSGTEVNYHAGYSIFWEIVAECYFSLSMERWEEDNQKLIQQQKEKQARAAKQAKQKAAMQGKPVDLSAKQFSNKVKGKAKSRRFSTDQIASDIANTTGGVCTPQHVYDYLVSVGHPQAPTITGTHTGGAGTGTGTTPGRWVNPSPGTGTITEARIRKLIRKMIRKNIFN